MPLKYLEYDKAKTVKPEWLWPRFIRLGKVCPLITGEGGVGKSLKLYLRERNYSFYVFQPCSPTM